MGLTVPVHDPSTSHLWPALAGAVAGFLSAVPVGPINLTILNEGARRGFGWGLLIGLGATLMEAIYCVAAFAGFAQLFTAPLIKGVMEFVSFVFMIYLGQKFLRARAVPARSHSEEVIEHRLHPHTAFWTGFVRCLGNPGVFFFWITVGATLMAHDWMAPTWPSKLSCAAGATAGIFLWFLLLSWGVSLGRGRLSEHKLVQMERVSGVLLLVFGLALGVRLVLPLLRSG
ncbi:MAG: LysE family transporter [Verrucomicrobia bacterium]|nr:LysE family transporter [Verrucomicrobiota bacterium]